MFPLHSWLLNAHVQAPTAGSIVLASILLKLGTFGFIRYTFGLLASISIEAGPYVCVLALAGVMFSSISSLVEKDAKKLIAQTSIAHMNICVLGLFSFTVQGFTGCVYMMIGHGVIAAALFYLIGILYDRVHTRELNALGGLASIMHLRRYSRFYIASQLSRILTGRYPSIPSSKGTR